LGGNDFRRGLPRDELERIAPALMLQLPTELFHNPEVLGFWQARSPPSLRVPLFAQRDAKS
jgi:hypothetical protein